MAKIVAKKKTSKSLKKAAPKKATKKVVKKTVKKAVKKAVKKTVKKAAPAPKRILTDSNGDPIGGTIMSADTPEKAPKSPRGTKIDTSKGGVSIRATKDAESDSTGKKSYSVIMKGGVPTKVEDNGDDL